MINITVIFKYYTILLHDILETSNGFFEGNKFFFNSLFSFTKNPSNSMAKGWVILFFDTIKSVKKQNFLSDQLAQ